MFSPQNFAKGWNTKLARGRMFVSQPEETAYQILVDKFGIEHVKRQQHCNGWHIDLKVDDVWVQVDGVYWHGLDRSIEEIMLFKSSQDHTIYESYLRDQAQNVFFRENKLKLVRITDVELSKSPQLLIERISACMIS